MNPPTREFDDLMGLVILLIFVVIAAIVVLALSLVVMGLTRLALWSLPYFRFDRPHATRIATIAYVFLFYGGFLLSSASGYAIFPLAAIISRVLFKDTTILSASASVASLILLVIHVLFILSCLVRIPPRTATIAVPHNTSIYTFVQSIAATLNRANVREIYISLNAHISASMSLLGRRRLTIGWSLFLDLTESEFKSVCAHELAHFDAQALRHHKRLFLIQQTIDRFNAVFDECMLRFHNRFVIRYAWPLVLLALTPARLFLGAFLEDSKARFRSESLDFEYYCDQIAATQYGTEVFGDALRRAARSAMMIARFQHHLNHRGSAPKHGLYDSYLRFRDYSYADKEIVLSYKHALTTGSEDHPAILSRIDKCHGFPSPRNEILSIFATNDKIRQYLQRGEARLDSYIRGDHRGSSGGCAIQVLPMPTGYRCPICRRDYLAEEYDFDTITGYVYCPADADPLPEHLADAVRLHMSAEKENLTRVRKNRGASG